MFVPVYPLNAFFGILLTLPLLKSKCNVTFAAVLLMKPSVFSKFTVHKTPIVLTVDKSPTSPVLHSVSDFGAKSIDVVPADILTVQAEPL